MTLPIADILWAGNNAQHQDHLHVEGEPVHVGYTTGAGVQPPETNPGMSPALIVITGAMTERYGVPYYFEQPFPPAPPSWSHMGVYNRRPIAGSTRWSQHAYANAIDIGPLNGIEEQEPIYDYLVNYEGDDMPTIEEIRTVIREELDRLIDGKLGTRNQFRGIGQAVGKNPIGNSGLNMAQTVQDARSYAKQADGTLDKTVVPKLNKIDQQTSGD